MKEYAIIEIGSNNTKTHVYDNYNLVYEDTTTIEFKKNYTINGKILSTDLDILFEVIDEALKYTEDIHIYGCSIFREMSEKELNGINKIISSKYDIEITVVSQEEEASYTALGCYSDIDYKKNICIFIGGGGSIELIFVRDKKIIYNKFYDFGVVDVTNKFLSLKNDIPECTFDEVYNYVDGLIGDIDFKADLLILAGGDHLYWYNCAEYELSENNLYKNKNQEYMLTRDISDIYDRNAFSTSLNRVRENSDNPLWFDGSRAMKVITNLISHKVDAKYIIPTRINMEDGIKNTLL